MFICDTSLFFPKFSLPTCQVFIVSGPPGSGKNYFVEKHQHPGDEVIDLDLIIAQLSGLALYQAPRENWLAPALRYRNQILSQLCFKRKNERVWFIVSASGKQWCWWKRALHPASCYSCWAPIEVCIARIKADKRRAHNVDNHIAACQRWFKLEQKAIAKIANRADLETDWWLI